MYRWKKQKRAKRIIVKGLKAACISGLALCILTLLQVLVLKFVSPPFTIRTACLWVRGKVTGDEYQWPSYHRRPLSRISPHLIRAVQAGEDQRFLSHHGFDFAELNLAVRDLVTMRRFRGASTISMQVARTVFLWPGRSWFRKSIEAYYTIIIEVMWGKKRILEMYLNTVDWGPGIMGAEAASRKYYHTNASRVTASEAAMMAAILPSPHSWSLADPSRYLQERQKKIMTDMEKMPLL